MRHLASVLVVLALFVSSFAFLAIPVANAESYVCWVLEAQYYNDMDHTATTTAEIIRVSPFHIYGQASLTLAPGETGTLRVAALVPASDTGVATSGTVVFYYLGGGFYKADLSACSEGSEAGGIADGRTNGTDLAAPLAAYCNDGGLAIWDIDAEGNGSPAFDVSAGDISAALEQAVASQQNVMVSEGMGNSLYALMSNELALVGVEPDTGKPYQHIMSPNVCG